MRQVTDELIGSVVEVFDEALSLLIDLVDFMSAGGEFRQLGAEQARVGIALQVLRERLIHLHRLVAELELGDLLFCWLLCGPLLLILLGWLSTSGLLLLPLLECRPLGGVLRTPRTSFTHLAERGFVLALLKQLCALECILNLVRQFVARLHAFR